MWRGIWGPGMSQMVRSGGNTVVPTKTIIAIADTHGKHRRVRVPDGDILVHAGDITSTGRLDTVVDFDDWLGSLPHPDKIVIAGNHDFCFQRAPAVARALLKHATYLEDQTVTVQGLRIYGSPWQPWFFDWAFNLRRGAEIRAKWDLIPDDADVLVTHGPPAGHGDRTVGGDDAGCDDLREALRRVRPKVHIFGHIHEGYGRTREDGIDFLNASTCDLSYRPVQPPLVYQI